MLGQLHILNINHLELIEDKSRVKEKIRKVGNRTYQVIKLTVLLFLPVGEIFWVQTIIRGEAPDIFFLERGSALHIYPFTQADILNGSPGCLERKRRTHQVTGLFYIIVAAFMRQTTCLAPAGGPGDGQVLYLSQERAGEGKWNKINIRT